MPIAMLYHSTHKQLSIGQIIEPGNWGNIILQQGLTHPSWKREIALEAVRAWQFPLLPSRLQCCFCCDNLDTIVCYHYRHNPKSYIYQVEIIDSDALCHRGDFNAVEPLGGRTMWQIAELYWRHQFITEVENWDGVKCTEILTPSSLRVIEKLNNYDTRLIAKKYGLVT